MDAAPLLSGLDGYLLKEGTHARLYDILGAHVLGDAGEGVRFAVWAPNAESVSVIGDWNEWDPYAQHLSLSPDHSGIWHGQVPQAQAGQRYKYHIRSHHHHQELIKADPFAFYAETPPATASRIWPLDYAWGDRTWMDTRAKHHAPHAPISIYEVHAGSWQRDGDNQWPGYRELAHRLADHVKKLGFTHVELMPICEHPFYGSWGYQTTGYYAPSSRYGTPQDLMYFVDHMHQQGIGVILDWVPSHFPTDAHGLHYFDGTHLYEHADPRQGFHPEWNSSIFNYGRGEVGSFLMSSALYWLDKYHFDGLRVDAVASMLYLDYARKEGEWIPNEHGGKENLEAVTFLRRLNQAIHNAHPDTLCIAEESTAWPQVSYPADMGGLGFGMKWNMGWMHDTLSFLKEDPLYRGHHLGRLTFSLVYAFNEHFVLPLSHDEVVHGKGSLLNKMPGDAWQRMANLRMLYGYMWTHPGKKLLFMGCEFGQPREWTHEGQLDWHVLQDPAHAGLMKLVAQLNQLYRSEAALHQSDFSREGFEWIVPDDGQATVIVFLRKAMNGAPLLVACNLTPVPRQDYRVGVPCQGWWREMFNSDALDLGGSGWGNFGGVESQAQPYQDRSFSLSLSLPPLSTIILRCDGHDA